MYPGGKSWRTGVRFGNSFTILLISVLGIEIFFEKLGSTVKTCVYFEMGNWGTAAHLY